MKHNDFFSTFYIKNSDALQHSPCEPEIIRTIFGPHFSKENLYLSNAHFVIIYILMRREWSGRQSILKVSGGYKKSKWGSIEPLFYLKSLIYI
jgi:hypothetical protein